MGENSETATGKTNQRETRKERLLHDSVSNGLDLKQIFGYRIVNSQDEQMDIASTVSNCDPVPVTPIIHPAVLGGFIVAQHRVVNAREQTDQNLARQAKAANCPANFRRDAHPGLHGATPQSSGTRLAQIPLGIS
jgi:hypothetical protein